MKGAPNEAAAAARLVWKGNRGIVKYWPNEALQPTEPA
jgi:hypothetical protein